MVGHAVKNVCSAVDRHGATSISPCSVGWMGMEWLEVAYSWKIGSDD